MFFVVASDVRGGSDFRRFVYVVVVACYDYSVKQNAQDHLSVAIDTAAFDKWLKYEANE